jgi:hypothetical protein
MSRGQTDLDPHDQRFVQQAKRALDQSVTEMKQAPTLRVQRARLQALDAALKRTPRLVWAGGSVRSRPDDGCSGSTSRWARIIGMRRC